jgi:hypothetical protein
MSQNQPLRKQSREQKRASFSESRTRGKAKALVGAVLFGMAAVVIYAAFNGSANSTSATNASVVDPPQEASAASPRPTPDSSAASSRPPTKQPATSSKRIDTPPAAVAPEREVAIPVAGLSDGKAKFFNYTTADKTQMRFFAMRSSDGVYRAALDACDVCYREKKGYTQDGDDMVCQKCGQRFHSALVNEVTGGCNPVAIARTVAGDKLVIKTSELESRKIFF